MTDENTYTILKVSDDDVVFLSHAYRNAFGSREMAWSTQDQEKAYLKLKVTQYDNPDIAQDLKVQII